jgi:hypothetical protein
MEGDVMRAVSNPVLSLIAVVACASACSDPRSVVPTAPDAPGVTRIEIVGPDSIAPGESVQLNTSLTLADGSVKSSSPSGSITWFTSNSGILQVSPSGVATARQLRGEARVTATFGFGSGLRSSSREIVVTPSGTFRLVGVVRDAESPTGGLEGARVEAGPGAAAATNSEGAYRLYGVPSNAVITISKPGYAPLAVPVQVTAHSTRDFQLVLSDRRITLAGRYTVVMHMASGCTNGAFDLNLMKRVYEASVTQTGPYVEVLLTEPRFQLNTLNRGNRFTGFADSSSVTFTFDYYDPYYYAGPTQYPNVAERLPDGTFFVPQGKSIIVGSEESLSGGFNAFFGQYDSSFPRGWREMSFCSSGAAQLTLTRR